MASASPATLPAPAGPEQHARAVPPLDRVLFHARGLQRLWHLVDPAALAWLVAGVDSVTPDLVTRRHLRCALELLRDDSGIPAVLRAALARLVVRSGVVPARVLLTSRYAEVRLAAVLSVVANP